MASRAPTTTVGPLGAAERITLIDALRGFALFGILAVNMEAFRGPELAGRADGASPDLIATWLIAFGFQTKFYVLFSFLFGYGLSVQLARAAARGTPLVPRYARRLLGLFLLGLAHAALLYVGDILVTYAILGVVLLLLRNAGDRVLLRTAAGLIAATVLLVALAGVAAMATGTGAAEAADPAEAARAIAATRGAPLEVIAERIRAYPGTLAFALFGQGPTALAMFLTGLWAGRRRLLERVDEQLPLLRRVRAIGFAVGVPGAIAWATYFASNGFAFGAPFLFAAAVDFATAPFLTAGYTATFALLYRGRSWQARLAPLVPLGRLALSNYLLQSVIGAFLFTGYGFGLFGRVGAAAGLALSIAIYAAQIPLSAWWLRRFAFGPAEWLLRSLTYAQFPPFRARPATRRPG